MRGPTPLRHEFVEFIPERLEPGVMYVSLTYATAVHLCCCGCGTQVVTPLSPTDWRLTFDGRSVSLWPSVGNSGLACGSHYVIREDTAVWCRKWSDDEIAAGRARDALATQRRLGPPQGVAGRSRRQPAGGAGAASSPRHTLPDGFRWLVTRVMRRRPGP